MFDMQNTNLTEIYIKLLGSEEGTLRPTQAVALGDNLYKVLPAADSDEDELWEFPPGSIVRCEKQKGQIIPELLLAVEKAV